MRVANPSWGSDIGNDNLRVQRMGLEGMKLDQAWSQNEKYINRLLI